MPLYSIHKFNLLKNEILIENLRVMWHCVMLDGASWLLGYAQELMIQKLFTRSILGWLIFRERKTNLNWLFRNVFYVVDTSSQLKQPHYLSNYKH